MCGRAREGCGALAGVAIAPDYRRIDQHPEVAHRATGGGEWVNRHICWSLGQSVDRGGNSVAGGPVPNTYYDRFTTGEYD